MGLNDDLQNVIKQIGQDESDRERTNQVRDKIRQELVTAGDNVGEVIASGSTARGTALRACRDVDVVLVYNEDQASVRDALRALKRSIDRRFPGASIREQPRSVRVVVDGIACDVVPGYRDSSERELFLIPDRDRDSWIQSAPRLYERKLNDEDVRARGLLRSTILLLKRWNNIREKPFRSFYLECMCYEALRSPPQSLADAVITACRAVAEKVMERLSAIFEGGPRIDDALPQQERSELRGKIGTLKRAMESALVDDRSRRPTTALVQTLFGSRVEVR